MGWFRKSLQKRNSSQEIPQLEVILLEEGADVSNKNYFVVKGRIYEVKIKGDISGISPKAMKENKKAAYDALDLYIAMTNKYTERWSFDIRSY